MQNQNPAHLSNRALLALIRWNRAEFAVDPALLRQCARVGVPVLGTSVVSCLGYVVFAGLVSGMGTTIFRRPLMALFSPVEAVVSLGAEMLRLVAFSEPFFGLMVVLEGIFYGLGRTRYAFVVEAGSMWGVRILFTFLCVRVWGLNLTAVWACMIADDICKAVLLTVPFMSKRRLARLLSPERGEAR